MWRESRFRFVVVCTGSLDEIAHCPLIGIYILLNMRYLFYSTFGIDGPISKNKTMLYDFIGCE
jgi:hypothetical protein